MTTMRTNTAQAGAYEPTPRLFPLPDSPSSRTRGSALAQGDRTPALVRSPTFTGATWAVPSAPVGPGAATTPQHVTVLSSVAAPPSSVRYARRGVGLNTQDKGLPLGSRVRTVKSHLNAYQAGRTQNPVDTAPRTAIPQEVK